MKFGILGLSSQTSSLRPFLFCFFQTFRKLTPELTINPAKPDQIQQKHRCHQQQNSRQSIVWERRNKQRGSATSDITDAHNHLTGPHSSGQCAVNAGFGNIMFVSQSDRLNHYIQTCINRCLIKCKHIIFNREQSTNWCVCILSFVADPRIAHGYDGANGESTSDDSEPGPTRTLSTQTRLYEDFKTCTFSEEQ